MIDRHNLDVSTLSPPAPHPATGTPHAAAGGGAEGGGHSEFKCGPEPAIEANAPSSRREAGVVDAHPTTDPQNVRPESSVVAGASAPVCTSETNQERSKASRSLEERQVPDNVSVNQETTEIGARPAGDVHSRSLTTPVSQNTDNVPARGRKRTLPEDKGSEKKKPLRQTRSRKDEGETEKVATPVSKVKTRGQAKSAAALDSSQPASPVPAAETLPQAQTPEAPPSGNTRGAKGSSPGVLGSETKGSQAPPDLSVAGSNTPQSLGAGNSGPSSKEAEKSKTSSPVVAQSPQLPPAANTRGAKGRSLVVPPPELKEGRVETDRSELAGPNSSQVYCASDAGAKKNDAGPAATETQETPSSTTDAKASTSAGDLQTKGEQGSAQPDLARSLKLDVQKNQIVAPVSNEAQSPQAPPSANTRGSKRSLPAIQRRQIKRGRAQPEEITAPPTLAAPDTTHGDSTSKRTRHKKQQAVSSDPPQAQHASPSANTRGAKGSSEVKGPEAQQEQPGLPVIVAVPTTSQVEHVRDSTSAKAKGPKKQLAQASSTTPPVKGVFLTRSKLKMLAAASGAEPSSQMEKDVTSTTKAAEEAEKGAAASEIQKQPATDQVEPSLSPSVSCDSQNSRLKESEGLKNAASVEKQAVSAASTRSTEGSQEGTETGVDCYALIVGTMFVSE